MARLVALLMAIVGLASPGCGGNSVPAPSSPSPAAASPPERAAEVTEAAAAVAATKTAEPADDRSVDVPQDAAESTSCERIVVLTPGGPLLMDISVTFNGRPHNAAFDELVQQVITAADTDGDGESTWDELLSNDKYLADRAGYTQPITERQRKMVIERYDESRDGKIQRNEALMWLGRDTQMSARPFSVRSDRTYSPNPRAASRVWQLIDADADGRLTKEELKAVAPRFWLFDADDDRVIVPGELASLREQLEAENPMMQNYYGTADTGRHAALHLSADFNVERLEAVLGSLYSPRQRIGVTSLGEATKLFDTLDENLDGWLEKRELEDFATVEPHLKLAVDFAAPAGPYEPPATVDLHHRAPEIGLIAEAKDHVVLSFGKTQLRISAHDLAPTTDRTPSLQRSQIRVMVHDQLDPMFGELDANGDGRLGEREIDACAERLLANDADGDGELSPDEAPASMIVAILRGERANEQAFYVPAVVARPLSDDAASKWFVRADFNRDGDISRREFLGSFELFSQLDADGDGFISAEEAAAFSATAE